MLGHLVWLALLSVAATSSGAGGYFEVSYPPSNEEGGLKVGATYTIWLPENGGTLRGVIVHQHGCGAAACQGGATAAYDLHWQALARKWKCALLGPRYQQSDDQDCTLWCDPRKGSEQVFLRALEDLGRASGHPEIAEAPWCLWGHSGGGFWAGEMHLLHPERVIAVWQRSGAARFFREKDTADIPAAAYEVPVMCNPGVKEKSDRFARIWEGMVDLAKEFRAKGAPIGLAPDPRTSHECGESRYLAIPFFDACLAMRLPMKAGQPLRAVDMSAAWLAPMLGTNAVPAADYQGRPEEAIWLPNAAVAKAWSEYVRTGEVSDTTPPPAPFSVRVAANEQGEVSIGWEAEADFESGLRGFVIRRDGVELASLPEKGTGHFGRPLFQGMSYHDTPEKPFRQLKFCDSTAAPGKHSYEVLSVNGAGLRSSPAKISIQVPNHPKTAAGTLELQCRTNRVGRYEKLEFILRVSGTYTNPFNPDEVDLRIRFTTPAGKTLEIPAFWDQNYERSRVGGRDWIYPAGMPRWRARFAPQELGKYSAVAWLRDSRGTAQSSPVSFQSAPSRSKGFLRVSGRDPRFLEFTEGQPFFPLGQNLAFIGSQQYVTLSKAEEIFSKLSANGANYLRIWTGCEDWAMAIEARKSAFGRSWDSRAPIVPMPGTESSGRKCLKLSGEKGSVRVDPSNPVALRPSARYVFSGKARREGGGQLLTDLSGKSSELNLSSAQPGEWSGFKLEFETAAGQHWLAPFSLQVRGEGTLYITDLSLREAAGGPELLWEADMNRPVRGYYNPLDSFLLDEVLSAAEKSGVYIQVCYLTRDVYMSALKNPASAEYEQAIADARKALRYAVARWGCSTRVGAWEYWNEMDPGLPTDRFYAELGEYLEQTDPYHHLRTTSTWGPSAKDCRHPKLDIADVHFYLRPSDKGRLEDEVHAVVERTRWIREQAPGKPARLGEFGLANEKWQPTEEMNRSREILDFHNGLWASALSGASGSAMFWWWDRLDSRDPYGQYRPVSRFIEDIPWTGGQLKTADATCSDSRIRVIGLQAANEAWIWLFNRENSWQHRVIEKRTPGVVMNATVEIAGLGSGKRTVEWVDTADGHVVRQEKVPAVKGRIRVVAPEFAQDMACRIKRR